MGGFQAVDNSGFPVVPEGVPCLSIKVPAVQSTQG